MKLTKNSVTVVIKNDEGKILIVKRPDDKEDALAGVWGFPGVTLRESETEEDAARRIGPIKLGVQLMLGDKLGEKTDDRGNYILHMSDYAATIVGNETPTVPQADTSITQYTEFAYTTDPSTLFPAAQMGSLCSQVYLQSIGVNWPQQTQNEPGQKL